MHRAFSHPLNRLTSCLFLYIAAALSVRAQITVGQQVGVDINTLADDTYGTASNWTALDTFSAPASALDLGTGNAISGVSVSLSSNGDGGFNALGGTATGNNITDAPAEVTFDGAWGAVASGPNVLTLTFSGLDTALSYDLEVFSLSNTHPLDDTPVINGAAATWASGFGAAEDRYYESTGAFFLALSPDSSGVLTFGISDAASSNAVMNGAILTAVSAVPEPATCAAGAGIAVFGFLLLRRRVVSAAV